MQAGASDMGGFLPAPTTPVIYSRWDRSFRNGGVIASEEFFDYDGLSYVRFRATSSAVRGSASRVVGSGDFYYEVLCDGDSAAPSQVLIGVCTAANLASNYPGASANGWGYYSSTGEKATGGVFTAYGAAYCSVNDQGVIGVRVDGGGNVHFISQSGLDQGVAFSIALGTVIYPCVGSASGAGVRTFGLNTGAKPFVQPGVGTLFPVTSWG